MNALTISKLANEGNVGVETVRYYQRRGLLNEPSRNAGIRRYGDEDVRRLRFIRAAQAAGFTLEEINVLLNLDTIDDRRQVREMAEARIAILDAKIAEMQAARAALSRLATECKRSKAQACPIITAFEL
ncbi:MerR family transcriptional regulator [Sphingobium sp.]|uniref:MerR family transcriptional regulator n=1 Tax=Sphingobium sp. TaxID=1912891 RepID=UPI003BB6F80F